MVVGGKSFPQRNRWGPTVERVIEAPQPPTQQQISRYSFISKRKILIKNNRQHVMPSDAAMQKRILFQLLFLVVFLIIYHRNSSYSTWKDERSSNHLSRSILESWDGCDEWFCKIFQQNYRQITYVDEGGRQILLEKKKRRKSNEMDYGFFGIILLHPSYAGKRVFLCLSFSHSVIMSLRQSFMS